MNNLENKEKEINTESFLSNIKGCFSFIRKYWFNCLILFLICIATIMCAFTSSSFIDYGSKNNHTLYVIGFVLIFVTIIGIAAGGFFSFKIRKLYLKNNELNIYKDLRFWFFLVILLLTVLIVGIILGIIQICTPNSWYIQSGIFGIIAIVVNYLGILVFLI